MYIGFSPYTTCLKVVSISCFCIYMCFEKIRFPFQKLSFGKYGFSFKEIFQKHKNGSNYLKYVEFYSHIFVFQRSNKNIFFGIYMILLDLIEGKKISF